MLEKRVLPKFESEAEKAKWWFEHQEELDQDFVKQPKSAVLAAVPWLEKQVYLRRRFGSTRLISKWHVYRRKSLD